MAVALVVFLVSGCGPDEMVYKVDPALARSTLSDVLESWKAGETPDAWRERDPEIIIQDFDWMSGSKLEKFELLPGDKAVDANWYCPVKLTLRNATGVVQREVTYLVSTNPKLTVFRQVVP